MIHLLASNTIEIGLESFLPSWPSLPAGPTKENSSWIGIIPDSWNFTYNFSVTDRQSCLSLCLTPSTCQHLYPGIQVRTRTLPTPPLLIHKWCFNIYNLNHFQVWLFDRGVLTWVNATPLNTTQVQMLIHFNTIQGVPNTGHSFSSSHSVHTFQHFVCKPNNH